MKKVWKGMWANKSYRDKVLKARKAQWKSKAFRARHRASIIARYDRTTKEERVRQTKAGREAANRLNRSVEGRKAIAARVRLQSRKQWADAEFKQKMLKVRKEQANRPEALKRNSKQAKKDWSSKKYRETQQQARASSYAYNVTRHEKTSKALLGKPSWNKGLTKNTHPSLMKLSKKFRGRVPSYGRTKFPYQLGSKQVLMLSTWEVAFAEYLDSQKLAWKYEPKFFYVGKGNWVGERYVPDFFVPAWKAYVEVKGYLSKMNRRKLRAFRRQHSSIKLILLDRKKLLGMGVKIK